VDERLQGVSRAQVAAVPNAVRTVLVDPLRRHVISVVCNGLVAQPGIETDRRGERWRRVQVGEQAPRLVQMPTHNAGCGADFLGRYRPPGAMLQHMEQGRQPRGVLSGLGRDIAHAAKCASRAQLALDLIVKAYPLGTRPRRQVEHRRDEAAARVARERLREQRPDALSETLHLRHRLGRRTVRAHALRTPGPCDQEARDEAHAARQRARSRDRARRRALPMRRPVARRSLQSGP